MFKKQKKVELDEDGQENDAKNDIHPSIARKQALIKKRLMLLLGIVVFAPALIMLIVPVMRSLSSNISGNVCHITEYDFFTLIAFDGMQKTITMLLPFLVWQTASLAVITLAFVFLLLREIIIYFNLARIEHPFSFVQTNTKFLLNFFIALFAINMASSGYLQAEKDKVALSTITMAEKTKDSEEFFKQCLDANAIVLSETNSIKKQLEETKADKKSNDTNTSDVPTPSGD